MSLVLKSSEAQLRAARKYRENNRTAVNKHMMDYYTDHKVEILRKKKVRYEANKKKKFIEKLNELLSKRKNVIII